MILSNDFLHTLHHIIVTCLTESWQDCSQTVSYFLSVILVLKLSHLTNTCSVEEGDVMKVVLSRFYKVLKYNIYLTFTRCHILWIASWQNNIILLHSYYSFIDAHVYIMPTKILCFIVKYQSLYKYVTFFD